MCRFSVRKWVGARAGGKGARKALGRQFGWGVPECPGFPPSNTWWMDDACVALAGASCSLNKPKDNLCWVFIPPTRHSKWDRLVNYSPLGRGLMWQVAWAVVGAMGCWEPSGVSGACGLPAWAPKPRGGPGGFKGQGAGITVLSAYSYLPVA